MPQSSNLVTVTQKRFRCRHVHAAGHQCGSPALRNEEFCYFHHTTRRPKPAAGKFRNLDAHEPFELPIVEDLPSALSVAAQILCRVASNDLDPGRAGKLLYNLQIITSIIDKASRAAAKAGAPSVPVSSGRVGFSTPQPGPLEEIIADETHGLIAPVTEFLPAGATHLASEMWDQSATQPASPPPERDYNPEERAYLRNTVFARGYEPRQIPRPASITDEDIQAHASAKRRIYGLSPLNACKDDTGRLISLHELGARHTIPGIAPQPITESPQPATLSTLQAAVPRQRRPGRKKTASLKVHRRKSRRCNKETRAAVIAPPRTGHPLRASRFLPAPLCPSTPSRSAG
jgi:hypothetical protein